MNYSFLETETKPNWEQYNKYINYVTLLKGLQGNPTGYIDRDTGHVYIPQYIHSNSRMMDGPEPYLNIQTLEVITTNSVAGRPPFANKLIRNENRVLAREYILQKVRSLGLAYTLEYYMNKVNSMRRNMYF